MTAIEIVSFQTKTAIEIASCQAKPASAGWQKL
jgi:hypothetical protein